MSNNEILRSKEKYLKILYKKYEALYEQKAKTLNDADKVSIDESINNLTEEIHKYEAEINQIRLSSSENSSKYRNYSLEWKNNLPKIDFKSSRNIIKNIIDKFDTQEAEEAIFLLQDSQSMAGRLLIEDIKSRIEKDIGVCNDTCQVGFLEYEQTSKEKFLSSLATRFLATRFQVGFQVEFLENNIIEGICKNLRSDEIFFITVDIYCLDAQDDFLEWFVEFWEKLVVGVILQRKQYPLIKLVAVISVHGLVPQSCLKEHLFCTKDDFDGKKILELPLHNWKEEDIWKWLEQHSGLRDAIGLELSEMKRMAKNIYTVTQGEPIKVYNQLIEVMSRKVA